MNKELYHRFSEIYLPGSSDIKDNERFSNLINDKIEAFVKRNKVLSYRIINCETQTLPPQSLLKSDLYAGYVMLVVHIAYTV